MAEPGASYQDRLLNDPRAAIADTEALPSSAADNVRDEATEARGRVVAHLPMAEGDLAHLQRSAFARARAAGQAADDYVRDNPWRVVGAAVGFGLLIGLLIGSR